MSTVHRHLRLRRFFLNPPLATHRSEQFNSVKKIIPFYLANRIMMYQAALGMNNFNKGLKTIILAGGAGTRLFPLSRELYPKQFIPMLDKETLFQKTLKRALIFSNPEEIYIITGKHHRFLVRDQILGLCENGNVLVEPEGKNTLPAIAWGVNSIVEAFGTSRVLVLPSDHLVETGKNYSEAVEAAEYLADNFLVTFGITPTHPNTGYGYIKPGEPVSGGFRVSRFIEKPDLSRATEYITSGYLWNSGMFLFSTDIFLEECALHASEILDAFHSRGVEEAFSRVPSISIDRGLMEKTERAAVVPIHANWSDMGSFDSLYQVFPKDDAGNAVNGEYIPISSSGNLIIGERLVITLGIQDVAIVDTKDVLFVGRREDSEQVKRVVEMLKTRGDERASMHLQVHRPWGSYTVLEQGRFYRIKRITVLPGRKLSSQLHHHRSEHWVVVQGTAEIVVGETSKLLKNGESTFVPSGVRHRLANPGIIPLEIIEVQIGEYIGEDDIIRYEDDYGRREESRLP